MIRTLKQPFMACLLLVFQSPYVISMERDEDFQRRIALENKEVVKIIPIKEEDPDVKYLLDRVENHDYSADLIQQFELRAYKDAQAHVKRDDPIILASFRYLGFLLLFHERQYEKFSEFWLAMSIEPEDIKARKNLVKKLKNLETPVLEKVAVWKITQDLTYQKVLFNAINGLDINAILDIIDLQNYEDKYIQACDVCFSCDPKNKDRENGLKLMTDIAFKDRAAEFSFAINVVIRLASQDVQKSKKLLIDIEKFMQGNMPLRTKQVISEELERVSKEREDRLKERERRLKEEQALERKTLYEFTSNMDKFSKMFIGEEESTTKDTKD